MRTLAIMYLTIYVYSILVLLTLNIYYVANRRPMRVYRWREVLLAPITIIRDIIAR